MNIYVARTDRMDITLNLSSRQIFVQQKWRYNWLIDSGFLSQSPWTIQEKRDFHNKSDRFIWKLWSSKAYAFMNGSSSLSQQYKKVKFNINIDIKWTIGHEAEHWNVNVYKIPPGEFRGSWVEWNSKKIELDSEDNKPRTDRAAAGQVPVTHELGHSFGYSSGVTGFRMDEYPTDEYPNPRYGLDKKSIMHSGAEIRIRHFNYLKQQLNLLLPSASFEIMI